MRDAVWTNCGVALAFQFRSVFIVDKTGKGKCVTVSGLQTLQEPESLRDNCFCYFD